MSIACSCHVECKQLCHIDQLKQADNAAGDSIQEHDFKKEELDCLIQASSKRGKILPAEEKSKINAPTQKVSKLDKKSMGLLAKGERLDSRPFIYGNLLGEEECQIWEKIVNTKTESENYLDSM